MPESISDSAHTFLVACRSGKTTLATQHLVRSADFRYSGRQHLIIAPPAQPAKPYQAVLRRTDLPPGGEVETLTIGGLAKRSVDLMWPVLAREAGSRSPIGLPRSSRSKPRSITWNAWCSRFHGTLLL